MAREMHTFDGQTAESAFWHEYLQQTCGTPNNGGSQLEKTPN